MTHPNHWDEVLTEPRSTDWVVYYCRPGDHNVEVHNHPTWPELPIGWGFVPMENNSQAFACPQHRNWPVYWEMKLVQFPVISCFPIPGRVPDPDGFRPIVGYQIIVTVGVTVECEPERNTFSFLDEGPARVVSEA